jgi:hypothetical protein
MVIGVVLLNVVAFEPTVLFTVIPPEPIERTGVEAPANVIAPSSMVMLLAARVPLTVIVPLVASVPAENTTSLLAT